jgi:hypothetical protein
MELCPYCKEPVSQRQAGEDDWIDFCDHCDVVVEGNTITAEEGE